jgi:acetyl esterase
MPLDPGAERLLRMLAASSGGAAAGGDALARRSMLDRLTQAAGDTLARGVATRDLVAPGPAGSMPVRLYSPEDGSAAALVYFHGGGWVAGGLETHDGLCRTLAASSRVTLIAVDYRLAPEHRFPAAFDDARASVDWVARRAGAMGLDPTRLAVGGDSVGGGLAAAVALGRDAPPLALQVLLCPILDLVNETASRRAFASGYFLDAATLAQDVSDYCGGEVDLCDPRVSPLLANDLTRMPPAQIHAAEYDPFRDEAQVYAERLSGAGVDARFVLWPGMIHYFYTLPRAIRGATPALEAIGAGIAEALA